jgi:hypothetical protein
MLLAIGNVQVFCSTVEAGLVLVQEIGRIACKDALQGLN